MYTIYHSFYLLFFFSNYCSHCWLHLFGRWVSFFYHYTRSLSIYADWMHCNLSVFEMVHDLEYCFPIDVVAVLYYSSCLFKCCLLLASISVARQRWADSVWANEIECQVVFFFVHFVRGVLFGVKMAFNFRALFLEIELTAK